VTHDDPKSVYALDLTKLIGFKADANYPRYVPVQIFNTSKATMPTADEQAAVDYLHKRFAEFGVAPCAQVQSVNGPEGPNYISINYNGYCPPEAQVMAAIAKMPEISANQRSVSGDAVSDYFLNCEQVPELSQRKQKRIPIRVSENITTGY
jgi:hypothetical protein